MNICKEAGLAAVKEAIAKESSEVLLQRSHFECALTGSLPRISEEVVQFYEKFASSVNSNH